MSNDMKISGMQVFWLMVSMQVGMTLLLTMTSAIQDAKQDAWLSMLIAGCGGILITYIATKLSLIYPRQTLIQFSQTILGKWIGKLIVIPYFVMWYSAFGVILRQSSDFIHLALFHNTPLWAVVLLLLTLVVYVTYQGGIEAIARCSELLGPFIVLMIVVVLALSYQNMHWVRILPVYQDTGARAILSGSVTPLSFMGESVMMMMLVAFMSNPGEAISRSLWGVGIACGLVFLSTLGVILTFGNLASRMWYPFFDMTRFVSFMEFIENIDAVIVIIWLLSVFVKLSLYLFIAAYGTAQWIGIKNWRRLMWIVPPIAFLIAVLPANMDTASISYPEKFWIPYVVPIDIVSLPILLWAVGTIRKKRTQ